ncbi:MAG TPA: nucleotidyltransferase domain-containing protein [Thermoanaerobaculia bacterium]|nr:nucleotidyltransferase domain-containing protein [Thermoanaerobaculia bacterium]
MRRNATGKPIDVEPYLDDLRRYLESQDGLVAAWIFGSYGTPYQTPLSDLDLALLYRQDKLPDSDELGRLYLEIPEILNEEDVSITILNRAPILFQFRAVKTGQRLVCRDPIALADFVEFVISRHSDFEVYGQKLAEEFGEAILEQFCYEM